jgi:hypothetical protein
MNKSESLKNFAAAMCQFQGEVKNPPKSADNPFFKSKYTTLDTLIDTAKPLLQKNGLSYLQSCSGDGANIIVTTLLMHNSGEWIESDPLTLKADKATAQGAGSAITYGRRYALAAALGLASDEDDDGNGAEPQKQPQQSKPAGSHNDNPNPFEAAKNDSTPSDIEKRATAIYFQCTGNKEGQLGWSKEKYKEQLKAWKDDGYISTDYGKKWTLRDVEWLESQVEDGLPF